jgi:hypothetical protein
MNLRQGGPTGAAADASFGIDQQARVDQANGGFMVVGELARQLIGRLARAQAWNMGTATPNSGDITLMFSFRRFPPVAANWCSFTG